VKNLGLNLFCACFFVILLVPIVLMPWADYQMTENRPPAPPPELIREGSFNQSLPDEVEAFLDDRFAGRARMIDTYSRLIGGVFGVSANDKVVMGRDGWLFFQETVGDFDGSANLSDDEMDLLISYLFSLKHLTEERGQVFLIAVAPNKNTLFGEFMPGRYTRTESPTNLERLLSIEGLDFIDFQSALLEPDFYTYYKTDSHWNSRGSRIAAREIMYGIAARTGVMGDIDFTGDGNFETRYITGDLGQMLFPVNPPLEADLIFDDARQNFTAVGRFRTLDDMHITTESDGAPLRVAMYRDSFANWLIPYFSNAYSNVYYTRQTPPPMDRSEFIEADVVVFQIVERRLGELLGFLG